MPNNPDDNNDSKNPLKYGVLNPIDEPNKQTYLPTADSDGPTGNFSRVVETVRNALYQGSLSIDGEYNGLVLDEGEEQTREENDSSNNWNFLYNTIGYGDSAPRKFFTVRIPEIHAMVPMPESQDDQKLISLHTQFINRSDEGLKLGDVVRVRFYSSDGVWMPQILEKVDEIKSIFSREISAKDLSKVEHRSGGTSGLSSGYSSNFLIEGLRRFNQATADADKDSLPDILRALGYESSDAEYQLALSIGTHEGWLPHANDGFGSRSYRNNNPGNLNMDGSLKQVDSYVQLENNRYDGNRFAAFSTPIKGMEALIELKIKRWARGDMPVTSGNQRILASDTGIRWVDGTPPTILEFFYTYAPPTDNNDTRGYINGVVDDLRENLNDNTITANTQVIKIIENYGRGV